MLCFLWSCIGILEISSGHSYGDGIKFQDVAFSVHILALKTKALNVSQQQRTSMGSSSLLHKPYLADSKARKKKVNVLGLTLENWLIEKDHPDQKKYASPCWKHQASSAMGFCTPTISSKMPNVTSFYFAVNPVLLKDYLVRFYYYTSISIMSLDLQGLEFSFLILLDSQQYYCLTVLGSLTSP